VVVVTHNRALADRADRILHLAEGVLAAGAAEGVEAVSR
jgi:predicted ABC-type transport system involved in lysophospholipase L1 biosynthesis ATPase subunit